MIAASTHSERLSESAAAKIKMRTRGLSTCLQSRRSGPRRCASSTLFGPTTASCSAARAAVSPFEPDPSDVLRSFTSRLQYGAVLSGTVTPPHLRVPRGYAASGGRRATAGLNTGCYPVGRLRLASACGNPVTAFDLCGDGSRNFATSARLCMRQMPAHALFERGSGRHDMPAMPTCVHGSEFICENAVDSEQVDTSGTTSRCARSHRGWPASSATRGLRPQRGGSRRTRRHVSSPECA